ncbi:hypothetical protein KIW84_045720 [Lathyrus oleraceus]|uniref:Uncharacterized protein n=1 Tax=Pisum sativum TaxID=3888 RepID=A0A9D4XLT6_PEA|nr:hypothetical protein KIW84_045720 [Pisum sativum]
MEYVTCFLKGLNDYFHKIRTEILLLYPLPNISFVYSLIAQQEVHIPPASSIESTILFANNPNSNGRGKGRGPSKSTMMCTNCHKINHIMGNCYFKHRFPAGYRTKNNRQSFPTDSKYNNSSEKPHNISKEDYQHLLLLLQQLTQDKANKSANNTISNDTSHVISGCIYQDDDWTSGSA